MTIGPSLKIIAPLLLISLAAYGQGAVNKYDRLTGWFELQLSAAELRQMHLHDVSVIVPIINRGTNYFTPYVGFEVPLQKTAEGLYLKADNSVTQHGGQDNIKAQKDAP